jgi:hypothetical protein
MVSGDWNSDGKLDLASVDDDRGTVRGFMGDGAGGFHEVTLAQFGLGPLYDIQALDWNGDGRDDLVTSGSSVPSGKILLGRPDGSFVPTDLPFRLGETRRIRTADYNEDGRPDFALVAGSEARVLLNTNSVPTGVVARAFVNDRKIIAVTSSSNNLTARLEPADGSFTADAVDPLSLRLTSDGTGSMSSIAGGSAKAGVLGDTDRNGVAEFPVSFAMADVAKLFDGLHGKRDVTSHLEGSLHDGTRFCAPLVMSIVVGGGGGGALAARVEPNPLNPNGVLRFSVDKTGPVTVRLFDLSGRLVRTIWDRRVATAGEQEVRIDGRDAGGRTMATGVYFFRIEADGPATSGRFTVLK